jgi:acyl-coenzyme A thioesterase PaaI-like protein
MTRFIDHPARSESRRCFACGPDNPHGLKLKFHQPDPHTIAADVSPQPHWCGWDGLMHGGFQCVLLDEVTAWAATILGDRHHFVTTGLAVKYRKPVRLDQPIRLTGRLLNQTHRGATAEGLIIGPDEQVLSEATAQVVYLSEERLKKMLVQA